PCSSRFCTWTKLGLGGLNVGSLEGNCGEVMTIPPSVSRLYAEAELKTLPQSGAVVVVGAPKSKTGRLPLAFVTPWTTTGAAAVAAALRQNLWVYGVAR